MDIQTTFYDLVSGRRQGLSAVMLRGMLQTLELPCTVAAVCRNFLYDHRILPVRHFPVPIVSIGNLTLGGTGKSPMTAWLCRRFLRQHLRPVLISRGYKKTAAGTHAGYNDEYLELRSQFPDVPHLQNRNRVRAAEELQKQYQPDVIILDDAFQHRRIARSLDIVLLDATAPFGFDHVFPRGTLREPIAGLKRADAVILSRSDMVSAAERQQIRHRVLSVNPQAVWGETQHVPAGLVPLHGTAASDSVQDYRSLSGKSVLAFCGIGNPPAFQKTLEGCGIRTAKLLPFPDHHRYTAADMIRIQRTAREINAEAVLCTMKDWVKFDDTVADLSAADVPVWGLIIEIQFTAGDADVCRRIDEFFVI